MGMSTYAELKAKIIEDADRDDLEDKVAGYIALCEADVSSKLRVRQMICRAEATISDEYETVPTNFAGVKAICLSTGDGGELRYVDPMALRSLKAGGAVAAGRPTHYSIIGEEFQFYPAPDGDYEAELIVYEALPALSDSNPSNWLLRRFPQVYVWGSLWQFALAYPGQPGEAGWQASYERALMAVRSGDLIEHVGARPQMTIRRAG